MTIAGEIQIFAFDRHTDIGMKFENIPLPIFNPYSGRFAGYNIAKGSLTTDLQYLIEDRKLDAKHHIRIDQLEWGEATESKEAVPLPIKLATSLLKDVDGVIDLDVPVTGTLDDPKFRIGPIVWQIIKNILVKAVTAPFRLLGSLFKGAEDAQFVAVRAGRCDARSGRCRADERAGEGSGAEAGDQARRSDRRDRASSIGPALVDRAFSAEIERGHDATCCASSPTTRGTAGADQLEPKQQIAVLTSVVETLTGAPPQLAAAAAARPRARRARRRGPWNRRRRSKRSSSRRAPRSSVDPLELQRLGQARGEAIQSALLAGGELHAGPRLPGAQRQGHGAGRQGALRARDQVADRVAPAHQAFLRDARDQRARAIVDPSGGESARARRARARRARRAASRRCARGGETTSRGRCSRASGVRRNATRHAAAVAVSSSWKSDR